MIQLTNRGSGLEPVDEPPNPDSKETSADFFFGLPDFILILSGIHCK